MRRSDSGAAVRLTRSSALGRASAARRAARAEASARGGPQLAMLVLGPAGFDPLELRASSAIPKGIAVRGESDALAARGGCAEDEPDRFRLWIEP